MSWWTRSSSVLGAGAVMATLVLGGSAAAADPSTTLRLATPGGDEGPVANSIRAFADRVAADTDGSLTIEPVWQAQVICPRVVTIVPWRTWWRPGPWSLALVPSRGFDMTGTTVLQSLQTPFLIDNDALAAAVATGAVERRSSTAWTRPAWWASRCGRMGCGTCSRSRLTRSRSRTRRSSPAWTSGRPHRTSAGSCWRGMARPPHRRTTSARTTTPARSRALTAAASPARQGPAMSPSSRGSTCSWPTTLRSRA